MSVQIQSKEQYEQAMARIDALIELDPPPGSPESEEYLALLEAVDIYEAAQAGG